MGMMRVNLMVSLVLLISASAAGQGVERITGDRSVAPGPWKQLAKLTESKGIGYDEVGWSVAISKDGNTVAVGADSWCRKQGFEGCGQGAVFVFVKPASGWSDMTETALLLASDGQPGDYLGTSVAISDDGNTVVSGAPLWPANGNGNGAAYVFVRPEGGWSNATETAKLTSTDGAGVNLGDSVSISGNTIAAGGEYFNGLQGAAYVFLKPRSGWQNMTQRARLTPSDGKGGFMGWSISIDGDTVVAGAPVSGIGNAGNGAYVFVKPAMGWKNSTETAKLTASRGTGFELGRSVSINRNTIAVGAPNRKTANGAIYVYVKQVEGWRSMTQSAILTVPPKYNSLGFSVSIDSGGANLIGGAPGWSDGIGQGAINFFVKPASGWKTTSNSNSRFTASDGRAQDGLGSSAADSPTATIAGAPYATIGPNPQEGAAYVFGR